MCIYIYICVCLCVCAFLLASLCVVDCVRFLASESMCGGRLAYWPLSVNSLQVLLHCVWFHTFGSDDCASMSSFEIVSILHMHTHMHARTHACMHECMHTYLQHTDIHLFIYTCIHTHGLARNGKCSACSGTSARVLAYRCVDHGLAEKDLHKGCAKKHGKLDIASY